MAYKTAPFLGRGLGFPFRVNFNTGQTVVTNGFYDSISVALEYLNERWTIRENLEPIDSNHIAECIHHILFTTPTEHDTLPEFGSKIITMLFEPNSQEFRLICESYLKHSTERWEKRAKFPEDEGVEWLVSSIATDRGQLPVVGKVEFLYAQHPKNLVFPFVDERYSRLQEYPSGLVDTNGHDLLSRYYNAEYVIESDYKYLRPSFPIDIPMAKDDTYYLVRPTDSWLLVAWYVYGDIRNWWLPFLCYVDDVADTGGPRDVISPLDDPPVGELLRLPSSTRAKLITARRTY